MESDKIANKGKKINVKDEIVVKDEIDVEDEIDVKDEIDVNDEVVVVTPEKLEPEVVDLTTLCDEEEVAAIVPCTSTTFAVYGNVNIHLTPAGGYHIKWKE
jgi:hypothetical protein